MIINFSTKKFKKYKFKHMKESFKYKNKQINK